VRPAPARSDPMVEARAQLSKLALKLGIALGVLMVLGLLAKALRKKFKKHLAEEDRYFRPTSMAGTNRTGFEQDIPPPLRPDPLTAGWSLELLKKIEWHRFEHVVAAYERELGNDAELTDFGPDGGVDVQVFEPGARTLKRVIQCKAFDKQRVGVELIRSFFGAMTLQKVPLGAFYTTSTFTDDALAIGRENESLDLVDGETFLSRIRRLKLSSQLKLFDVATEGDYTTPTSASCGVKMLLKTAGKGRSEGTTFWGCRNYPRCQSTLKISAT
jgi:restriction system protein